MVAGRIKTFKHEFDFGKFGLGCIKVERRFVVLVDVAHLSPA